MSRNSCTGNDGFRVSLEPGCGLSLLLGLVGTAEQVVGHRQLPEHSLHLSGLRDVHITLAELAEVKQLMQTFPGAWPCLSRMIKVK